MFISEETSGVLRKGELFPAGYGQRKMSKEPGESEGFGGYLRPLSSLSIGEEGVIVEVERGDRFARRLKELGFIPGSKVRVLHRSPLGDPVEYEVRGSRFCLRRRDSRKILVVTPEGREGVE